MGFDLATAKPAATGGFDLASARPAAPPGNGPTGLALFEQNYNKTTPEADPVRIYETDPNTGAKTSRMQQPSGTRPRATAEQKQAAIDNAARLAAPDKTWRDDNLLGNVMGIPDAAIGVLGSMGTAMVAPAGGFIQSLFNGKNPQENANAIAERIAPRPATGTGRRHRSISERPRRRPGRWRAAHS